MITYEVFIRVCKEMECELVGRLKSASSHQIRKRFGYKIKRLLWERHLWRRSYCVVSCGGASLEVVKSYVKNKRGPLSELKQESLRTCFV